MTQIRILNLAYAAAVTNWARATDCSTADPNNPYAKARERRAWTELKEIEDLLKKEESK